MDPARSDMGRGGGVLIDLWSWFGVQPEQCSVEWAKRYCSNGDTIYWLSKLKNGFDECNKFALPLHSFCQGYTPTCTTPPPPVNQS